MARYQSTQPRVTSTDIKGASNKRRTERCRDKKGRGSRTYDMHPPTSEVNTLRTLTQVLPVLLVCSDALSCSL